MENNHKNKWYLGLDIGSNSVGWSATDTDYNILTKNQKLQCGARLFEDAKDASERRGFRSTRRRLARRKVRIALLQELFDPAIASLDPSFFIRMNHSGQYDYLDNGDIVHTYPLFLDGNYDDRKYYHQFPTVYHLRQYLMKTDVTDPRLLYLACHHLIKYRGHFLFENFNAVCGEKGEEGYEDILRSLGTDSLQSLKQNKAIANALNGNKIQLDKIFPEEEDLKERLVDLKSELKAFKFDAEEFEVCQALVSEILSAEQHTYLLTLKSLYDRIRLNEILNGSRTVSEAMVKQYDENAADTKLLKSFIRTNLPDAYPKVFRENGIYANYVGFNHTHGKVTISHDEKCKTSITTISYEDFLKQIAAFLLPAKDKEGYETLQSKI
jgi:CRISPR-associated endonuclease Csn1